MAEVAPAPAGLESTNAVARAAPPPADSDPASSGWRQQVEQLSRVHQHFVGQQAQIHQRFLALRQNMQEMAEALGHPGANAAPAAEPLEMQEPRGFGAALAPASEAVAVPAADPGPAGSAEASALRPARSEESAGSPGAGRCLERKRTSPA